MCALSSCVMLYDLCMLASVVAGCYKSINLLKLTIYQFIKTVYLYALEL